jgi:biotin synthase
VILSETSRNDAKPIAAADWMRLADQIADGHELTAEEGLAILSAEDAEVPNLLAAAYRLRRATFGHTVQLYFLMNAKSGLCPEDCHYCSQSKISEAEIPKYNLLSRNKLLEGARMAVERQSKTYCIVISARGPSEREIAAVEAIVPEIKQKYGLDICACLGLLTPEQAVRLKACGVDKVNHNLNTSREHYGEICTTHTYDDRLSTLRAVRDAGMQLCSGGIVGMGEVDRDIVNMMLELRSLSVESIPVNFLNPIDGTPLAGDTGLNPRRCLKILALARFANPRSEIRIAGGREVHLRSLQPLGLYAANSIFVGDYLTTKGQLPEEDMRMIADLGFVVTKTSPIDRAGNECNGVAMD